MEFLQPTTWADAVEAKASHPDAVPIAGGTDLMVELNFGAPPPTALLDLTGVAELSGWDRSDGVIRLGAGVTYAQLIADLGAELPALATASRTVGSPQIRNRATIAGNLGTASPAGDAHPPLLATGATVEAQSVRGTRLVPIDDFFLGVKRNELAPDELIRAVRIPVVGPAQEFAKVGSRNAMVIAVCSFAVAIDASTRTVRTGIGSAAPTPRRATEAEAFAVDALPWDGGHLDDEVARAFGDRVAMAAAPIDDVRGTAPYRRRALAVLGRRTLTWAWHAWEVAG
jgi:CO/xanthine dehydrogenase FAD-binding subunit